MDLRGTSATMRNIEGDIHAIKVYHTDAYKLAVQQGFEGTLNEWLASLKGAPGDPGKSAYQYAVDAGFKGTEEEFTQKLEADEVLEVEYGVTPIAEIVDAHNAGKAIVCKHGGLLLPMVQRDRNIATFSGIYDGKLHVIVNNDGEWRWTSEKNAMESDTILVVNRDNSVSGLVFDKTYEEVYAAHKAERTILLRTGSYIYYCAGFATVSGSSYFIFRPFVLAYQNAAKQDYKWLKLTEDNTWSENDTGFELMTEAKVKTLIEENVPEGMTEEEVKALIEESAPEGITEEEVLDLIKNNASGGGLLVTVTATQTGPGSYSYSMDSDYATIKAEVDEGKEVIIRCQRTHDKQTGYQYYKFHHYPDPGCMDFISLATLDGTYEMLTIARNGISFTTYDMPILKTTAQELTDSQKEQARENIGAGTASEWSDLGEAVTDIGETLTWDGNTEGLANFDMSGGNGAYVYKVSDNIFTAADCSDGVTVRVKNGNEDVEYNIKDAITFEADGFGVISAYVFVIPYDNYMDGFIPEAGIYFAYNEETVYVNSLTIPGYNFTESTIKPVPEKYLPMDAIMAEIEASAEVWTFTLEDGTEVTKKVVLT